MKTATCSPIRVVKSGGFVFFSTATYTIDGQIKVGFESCHVNYNQAKKMFWDTWKEIHPGVFLKPKCSTN